MSVKIMTVQFTPTTAKPSKAVRNKHRTNPMSKTCFDGRRSSLDRDLRATSIKFIHNHVYKQSQPARQQQQQAAPKWNMKYGFLFFSRSVKLRVNRKWFAADRSWRNEWMNGKDRRARWATSKAARPLMTLWLDHRPDMFLSTVISLFSLGKASSQQELHATRNSVSFNKEFNFHLPNFHLLLTTLLSVVMFLAQGRN